MKYLVFVSLAFGIASAALSAPLDQSHRVRNPNGDMQYRHSQSTILSNTVVITCPKSSGAFIEFSVGGSPAYSNPNVVAVIDGKRFAFVTDPNGYAWTTTKEASLVFQELWKAIRIGKTMKVMLDDEQEAIFTLKGTSKTFEPRPCKTGFNL